MHRGGWVSGRRLPGELEAHLPFADAALRRYTGTSPLLGLVLSEHCFPDHQAPFSPPILTPSCLIFVTPSL